MTSQETIEFLEQHLSIKIEPLTVSGFPNEDEIVGAIITNTSSRENQILDRQGLDELIEGLQEFSKRIPA